MIISNDNSNNNNNNNSNNNNDNNDSNACLRIFEIFFIEKLDYFHSCVFPHFSLQGNFALTYIRYQ